MVSLSAERLQLTWSGREETARHLPGRIPQLLRPVGYGNRAFGSGTV